MNCWRSSSTGASLRPGGSCMPWPVPTAHCAGGFFLSSAVCRCPIRTFGLPRWPGWARRSTWENRLRATAPPNERSDSRHRGQLRHELARTNSLGARTEWIPLLTRVDKESPRRLQIVASGIKSFSYAWAQAPLDLDSPAPAARKVQPQIDLRPRCGSIEARQGPLGRDSKEGLDDAALPTRPDYRMPGQLAVVLDAEQGMQKAAVAQVDFRRLDRALSRVRGKGRQTTHEQKVDEQIDVARGRGLGDQTSTRQARGVQ